MNEALDKALAEARCTCGSDDGLIHQATCAWTFAIQLRMAHNDLAGARREIGLLNSTLDNRNATMDWQQGEIKRLNTSIAEVTHHREEWKDMFAIESEKRLALGEYAEEIVVLAARVLSAWDSCIEDMEMRAMHDDDLYKNTKELYRRYERLVDAEVAKIGPTERIAAAAERLQARETRPEIDRSTEGPGTQAGERGRSPHLPPDHPPSMSVYSVPAWCPAHGQFEARSDHPVCPKCESSQDPVRETKP